MYYQLLNYKIDTLDRYNVYLDIKDTLSAQKVRKLKEILNVKFGVFRNVQNICSHESLLMQLTDLIMGAIAYNVNDKEHKNLAKVAIIERIKKYLHVNALDVTNYSSKLNLFFINLRWDMPFNLTKKYNDLLDIMGMSESQRIESLRRIFNRDVLDNPHFTFNGK